MTESHMTYMSRDDAFAAAIDLSSFVLEYANAYHSIAGEEEFMGKKRIQFAILLLMLDGMGKLLRLVQECERAAKADYENVQVKDFEDRCLNAEFAAKEIANEVAEAQKAFQQLRKEQEGKRTGVEMLSRNVDFCALMESMLFFQGKRSEEFLSHIPSEETMDIYASVIERNSLGAADYIHELAKALGLWRESGVRPIQPPGSPKHALRYGHKKQSRILPR